MFSHGTGLKGRGQSRLHACLHRPDTHGSHFPALYYIPRCKYMARCLLCLRSRAEHVHVGAVILGCPSSVHARRDTQRAEQTLQLWRDCCKNTCGHHALTLTGTDPADVAAVPRTAWMGAPRIRTTTHGTQMHAHTPEAPRAAPSRQSQQAYGSRNVSQHLSSAQHSQHVGCRGVSS